MNRIAFGSLVTLRVAEKHRAWAEAIALARELGISLKTLAMAMRIEVEDIPDDGLSLAQLKAVCRKVCGMEASIPRALRQLGIERIEELPDNFKLLLLPRPVDSGSKPSLD